VKENKTLSRRNKNMKKILSLVALSVLGASLASCSNFNNSNYLGVNNTINTKQIVGYQMVTSSTLLTNNTTISLVKRAASEIDQTISFLGSLDLALNNSKESLKIESVVSDKEEYQTKEVVSFTDLQNKEANLIIYYNSINNTSVEDDEKEEKNIITGILVKENKEYYFNSIKEIEEEKDESDYEIETKIFTSEDKKSYVYTSISRGIETNEIEEEYEYKVIKNNKEVSSYSYSKEVEDNEIEIELEYDNKEYEVTEFSKDNKQYIKIEEKADDSKKVIKVYEKVTLEDGTVTYNLVK